MPNLLDLMSEKEKKIALDSYEKRKSGIKDTGRVSQEMYLLAKLLRFGGWGAIEAVKRGYVGAHTDKGEFIKIPLSMAEIHELIRACDKVEFSKSIDMARANLIAINTSMSKSPATTWNKTTSEMSKGIPKVEGEK